MILAINYANELYKKTQHFNSKRALKYGADRVREYGPEDIDITFKEKNKHILCEERGNGYWLWKPYIIKDALCNVKYGDYVLYTDAASAFVNSIDYLINAMNKSQTDIMLFQIDKKEKYFTKQDAFILLDCDSDSYKDSYQLCASYILIKKTDFSIEFINLFLEKAQDYRLITNASNEIAGENVDGFVEHRHDQSILSLLAKKKGLVAFRDPSEWGIISEVNKDCFPEEILEISDYPQIIESHRRRDLCHWYQLRYKKWYRWFDISRSPLCSPMRRVCGKIKHILWEHEKK